MVRKFMSYLVDNETILELMEINVGIYGGYIVWWAMANKLLTASYDNQNWFEHRNKIDKKGLERPEKHEKLR